MRRRRTMLTVLSIEMIFVDALISNFIHVNFTGPY